MGFLAPWMLFGAAAAAIPVILHLFFRTRYRTVPWAAMKFLLASLEETSRRLKFQELLLLVLRCLVLALLAFAMARPVTSALRGMGRGDAVDAVFLVDVSASMSAADGAMTRLDRAKAAAIRAIEKLPAQSTVQIVAFSDRARVVGPRSPTNLDQARGLLQELSVSHLASDPAPALAEAKTLLDRGQLPNKEVHVFSDFQKSGWDHQASATVEAFRELKDRAAFYLVRCGSRPVKNAAIVGIVAQAGIPRPGERVGFSVLVRNTGAEAIADVRVSLSADGDEKGGETQTLASLAPGETRAAPLAARFEKAGPRVLTAKILHDDLDGDNRYDLVVPVRDQVQVLVVNGGQNEREPAKSSTFFLNHALLPIKDTDRARYPVQVREVEPRVASPALLQKADVCILVNVAAPDDKRAEGVRRAALPSDFAADLAGWVKQGRGLVIVPGENVVPDAYNKAFASLLPLPYGKIVDDAKKARKLNRDTFRMPDFWKFKEDRYFVGFNETQTTRAFAFGPASEGTAPETAVEFDDGTPALVARRVEQGEVFAFASALEPQWTDLPIRREFIPLVQTLFAHLLHGQSQSQNVVAGQSLVWRTREKEPLHYSLRTPDGGQVRLGLADAKTKTLAIGDLDRAGVYRLLSRTTTRAETAAEVGAPIAVTTDLRDTEDLTSLTKEQIDARLGFAVTHASAEAEDGGASGADRFRREWTLWVLLAVLLAAVGEMALAWLCGRAW